MKKFIFFVFFLSPCFALAAEEWKCVFSGESQQQKPKIAKYKITGDILTHTNWCENCSAGGIKIKPGFDYKILQNTESYLTAAASIPMALGPIGSRPSTATVDTIILEKLKGEISLFDTFPKTNDTDSEDDRTNLQVGVCEKISN